MIAWRSGYGLRERVVMAKPSSAAIAAQEKARARRLAMEQDRVARDERIDGATAAVIVASAEMDAARTESEQTKATARQAYEAALAEADTVLASALASGEAMITDAVKRLVAEKLSTGQIAELTELTTTQVRRLGKDSGSV